MIASTGAPIPPGEHPSSSTTTITAERGTFNGNVSNAGSPASSTTHGEERDDPKARPLLSPAATPEEGAAGAASSGPDLIDRRQGLQRAKSKSWRQLADYVNNGEVLVASPSGGSGVGGGAATAFATIPARPRTPSCDSLDTAESRRKERESILQLKRWQFQQLANFTLTQCLLALLLHVAIAVLAFSFVLHQWSVIDSVYFAVVTFSLVGYGDLVPQSHAARFFTCAYALAGVTCLGIAIGVVSSNVAEAQEHALQEAKEMAKKRALALFADDPLRRQGSSASSSGQIRQHHQNQNHQNQGVPTAARSASFSSFADPASSSCEAAAAALPSSGLWFQVAFRQMAGWCVKPLWGATPRMACSFAAVVLVLFAFGVVISHDPAMAPSDIPYFVVVTATTLGFGEVVPSTPSGRLATALFIPVAVGAVGHWLAIVAKFIVDRRHSDVLRKYLESQVGRLTAADLHAMDSDDDGNVTRAEFLEFMLLAMSKVDKALLEELRNHFDRLDADKSGLLSKSDLIEAARRRLKTPARKLELSRYKTRLLRQGAAVSAVPSAATAKPKEVSWWTRSGQKLLEILDPEVDGSGEGKGGDSDPGGYRPVPAPHSGPMAPQQPWVGAATARPPGDAGDGDEPPRSRRCHLAHGAAEALLPIGSGDRAADLWPAVPPESREVV